MKTKKYVQGVTFFITPTMYEQIKQLTDKKQIGLSEFLRGLIDQYFDSEPAAADVAQGKKDGSTDSEGREDFGGNDLH